MLDIVSPDFLKTEITYDSKTHRTFINGYPATRDHAMVVLSVLVSTLVVNGVLGAEESANIAAYAAGVV